MDNETGKQTVYSNKTSNYDKSYNVVRYTTVQV